MSQSIPPLHMLQILGSLQGAAVRTYYFCLIKQSLSATLALTLQEATQMSPEERTIMSFLFLELNFLWHQWWVLMVKSTWLRVSHQGQGSCNEDWSRSDWPLQCLGHIHWCECLKGGGAIPLAGVLVCRFKEEERKPSMGRHVCYSCLWIWCD